MLNATHIRGYVQQPYTSEDVVEFRPHEDEKIPKQWLMLRKLYSAGNAPIAISRTHGHHVSNRTRAGLIRGAAEMRYKNGTHIANVDSIMAAIRKEKPRKLQTALIASAASFYYSDALVNPKRSTDLFKFVLQQVKRQRSLGEKAETIGAFFANPDATPERAAPVFAHAMSLIPKLSPAGRGQRYRRLSQNLHCVPETQVLEIVDKVREFAETLTPVTRALYLQPLVYNLEDVPWERRGLIIDEAIAVMNFVPIDADMSLIVAMINKLGFMQDIPKQTVIHNVLTLTAPLPGPLGDAPLNNERRACYLALIENLNTIPDEHKEAVFDRAVALLNPGEAKGCHAAYRAFIRNSLFVPSSRVHRLFKAYPRDSALRAHYMRVNAFFTIWRSVPDADVVPMAQSIIVQNKVFLGKAGLPIMEQLLSDAQANSKRVDLPGRRVGFFVGAASLIETAITKLKDKR